MNTIVFRASNIKCMGCVNTIREGLTALDGVDHVEVETEQGKVTVTGNALDETVLRQKCAELGYPPAE